jgi:hypothetical protein
MDQKNIDIKFADESITVEESFWVMYYFLESHYDLSEGSFDVSDILSASAPFNWMGMYNDLMPADRGMISYWNEALEKFKTEGKPEEMKLRK